MIPKELEAKILRLYHADKWPIGTIAEQLGVHHSTVSRVIEQEGAPPCRQRGRPSLIDPYIPFIVDTLKKYPRLLASRLYGMAKERGYQGGPDHFRKVVKRYRPSPPAEAYLRLHTLPGEQAQVDWAHFGQVTMGRAKRPLMAFMMVLSWSRQLFVRFFLSHAMSSFLRGHVEAFECMGGVARTLLYDNLKSAVLERTGDAIRFNPNLLAFAAHYHYEPRPVAVGRGNEKGRVERAIRYLRQSFFAGREWRDLDDLNTQARAFCNGLAAQRVCPADGTMTVGQAFAEEKARLLPLPEHAFPVEERLEVKVRKTPYVRFDHNDYSIPHTLVQQSVVVLASETLVRVLKGHDVVATHPRSYDKGDQVEDPAHIAKLVEFKHQARDHRGMNRLYYAAPSSQPFLVVVGDRGGNIGSITSGLLRLLDQYGVQELELSIAEALANDTPHLAAVRQILDRRCHQRGAPPPLPVTLPDDPRVRTLVVKPHPLKTYDDLKEDSHGNSYNPK